MATGQLARTLYFDVETSPNLAYVWAMYQQDVIAVERDWYMLSCAWKWAGSRKVECLALPDFPQTYKKSVHDDSQLMDAMWNLFDQADIVVAHNGDRFDLRKSNARMAKHRFNPYSPVKSVDTLKIARQNFKFNSNRLNDLAIFLGLGKKVNVQTNGNKFGLWLRCQQEEYDDAAWQKMKRYNMQDVRLLEQVHHALRPWDTSHPNITLATGKSFLCPVCGSKAERVEDEWVYHKSWRSQLFVCTSDKCGKHSKGPREKLKARILVA